MKEENRETSRNSKEGLIILIDLIKLASKHDSTANTVIRKVDNEKAWSEKGIEILSHMKECISPYDDIVDIALNKINGDTSDVLESGCNILDENLNEKNEEHKRKLKEVLERKDKRKSSNLYEQIVSRLDDKISSLKKNKVVPFLGNSDVLTGNNKEATQLECVG